MATRQILKTILGSQIGLDSGGALLINKNNGTQIVVDSTNTFTDAMATALQSLV